jgi:hypothetical protein
MNRKNLTGLQAWDLVCNHIRDQKSITSVTKITYQARVSGNTTYYKGGNRSGGDEEPMIKEDFVKAFDAIKNLDTINTYTIKGKMPNALYRKRTPFIAMLLSAGII